MTSITHVKGRVRPIRDHILVEEMHFGERRTLSGVIILADDGVDRGIRARWARVYAVGPKQTEISSGQYVLVAHGRWTRGVDVTDPESGKTVTLRRVDNDDVLAVSDLPVEDETIAST